jgi:hypothetical protein
LKTKLLFLLLVLSIIANAQGTWTQKSPFGPGTREGEAGFSIGTKGYFAAGSD